MSFRLLLNIRLAVWLVLITIACSRIAGSGWHGPVSGFLVLVAFIDRTLCVIAHRMEAKAVEAEKPARRGWSGAAAGGYTPDVRAEKARAGV